MDEVTEGSEFLKKLFLDDDKRTLYVQTWGGTNTTARALKSIEEEYSGTPEWDSIRNKINSKLVIYIILNQDDSYSNYIAKNWSGIKVINDRCNFWRFAYMWQFNDEATNVPLKAEWYLDNLKGKGALLDHYSTMGDGRVIDGELHDEQRGIDDYLEKNPSYSRFDFISEGDSPSFLYLVDNGLKSYEDPSFGGWGGRFGLAEDAEGKRWINNVTDYNPATKKFEATYTLTRWFMDMQNDFASRADWCVADDFSKANHAPSCHIKEGNAMTAKAGQKVKLQAVAEDSDGNSLSYRWWRYAEADSYKDEKRSLNKSEETGFSGFVLNVERIPLEDEIMDGIVLEGSDTQTVCFTVPEDAESGDTIMIILEVQDDGRHCLKHYDRAVITVK